MATAYIQRARFVQLLARGYDLTSDYVLQIFNEAIRLAFMLAAPVLLIASVVGLFIALVQAASQIHEQTMTFAPKAIAVTLGLLVAGAWMITNLSDFMRHIFEVMTGVGIA